MKTEYVVSLIVWSSVFLLMDFASTPEEITIGYLFSHGIADSHRQAFAYLKKEPDAQVPYSVDGSLVTFDYPDVAQSYTKVNRYECSLGQDCDIERLVNAFYTNFSYHHHAVGIGVSRGASTLINFMGIYRPTTMQAAILESPFDCMEHVVLGLIHRARLNWVPGSHAIGMALTRFIFTKYQSHGVRPIDVAPSIDYDLPILFICSKEDKLVPVWSTINLYRTLRNSNHQRVHLLILPSGNHAKLIHDSVYGTMYQNVVQAFYKKYNLPHDKNSAEQGQILFARCQPTEQELSHFYPIELQHHT